MLLLACRFIIHLGLVITKAHIWEHATIFWLYIRLRESLPNARWEHAVSPLNFLVPLIPYSIQCSNWGSKSDGFWCSYLTPFCVVWTIGSHALVASKSTTPRVHHESCHFVFRRSHERLPSLTIDVHVHLCIVRRKPLKSHLCFALVSVFISRRF